MPNDRNIKEEHGGREGMCGYIWYIEDGGPKSFITCQVVQRHMQQALRYAADQVCRPNASCKLIGHTMLPDRPMLDNELPALLPTHREYTTLQRVIQCFASCMTEIRLSHIVLSQPDAVEVPAAPSPRMGGVRVERFGQAQ